MVLFLCAQSMSERRESPVSGRVDEGGDSCGADDDGISDSYKSEMAG